MPSNSIIMNSRTLTVARLDDKGFVYFKGTKSFARPHNLSLV